MTVHRYLRQRKSAIIIQAALRRWAVSKDIQRTKAAAIAIQAGWRGHIARQWVATQAQASIVIQVAAHQICQGGVQDFALVFVFYLNLW